MDTSVVPIFLAPEIYVSLFDTVTEQLKKLDITSKVSQLKKNIPEKPKELNHPQIVIREMIRFESLGFIREHQILPECELKEKPLSMMHLHELLKRYHDIDSRELDFGFSRELFWRRVLAKINDVNLVKVFQRLGEKYHISQLSTIDEMRRWFYQRQMSIGTVRDLDLSRCGLSYLPKELQYFSNLEELNLSNNRLFCLPEWFSSLQTLTKLDLSVNAFTTIPEGVCQLTELLMLDLSVNAIKDIPESISQLEALKVLSLSSNKISSLPSSFIQLENLKYLSLMSNEIKEFPLVICKLDNLRKLYLSSNYITALPEEFKNLEFLKALDLSYNPLERIPFDLMRLEGLIFLALEGTPMACLSFEVTEKLEESGVEVVKFVARL